MHTRGLGGSPSKSSANKVDVDRVSNRNPSVSAVGHYTAAMVKDPTSSTYPLNRAMAFLKLNK